jgi:hypothetical protein
LNVANYNALRYQPVSTPPNKLDKTYPFMMVLPDMAGAGT